MRDDLAAETFGDLLQQRRRRRGLLQKEVADKVGINVTYLSKLENNAVAPPSEDTIARIAGALRDPVGPYLKAARKLPIDLGNRIKRYPAEATEVVRALGERAYDIEIYRRLLKTLKDASVGGPPGGRAKPRLARGRH